MKEPMNAPGATSESQRLDLILNQISTQAGASRQREAQAFAAHFFRHVPADDISARDAAEWARIAQFMLEFVRQRKPHAAKIRVFNPHMAEEGFDSAHTMIA